MKKLLRNLFGLICMLVMVSCGDDTPTAVAEGYLDDLKAGKYQELVDNLHFKKEISDNNKQQLVLMLEDKATKTIEKKGAIQSYEIISEEIAENGEKAVVRYNLNYANDTDKNQKIDLVKVDGKWKVSAGK